MDQGPKTRDTLIYIFPLPGYSVLVFGAGVEWANGIIPIFFDSLETHIQQRFRIGGHRINMHC